MLIIKKILMPRLDNLSFIQLPLDAIEGSFENAVRGALFSLPEEGRDCYYTLSVNRGESPADQDFFVTVDIDLAPHEGELFVFVANDEPQIKNFSAAAPPDAKMFGTVCQVSRRTPAEFESCDIAGSVKNKTIRDLIESF